MYGHHTSIMAAAMLPLSAGVLFAAGWYAMALVTLIFVIASLVQLVRSTKGFRP